MRPKFELGFRSLDARWMRLRWRGGLMRSKFEAWIPKLGCEVDATKSRSQSGGLMRSCDRSSKLGFRSWIPGIGCDEASVEVNWESDAIK